MAADTSDASSERAKLARDIVRRALAVLRERNQIPSVDLPPVTVTALPDARGYATPVASELAQAAEAADLEHPSAEALATTLAAYLDETVGFVPAYSEFASVIPVGEGVIHLYLRAE